MSGSGPVTNNRRDAVMTKLFTELQVARFNQLFYERLAARCSNWSLGMNIVSALAGSAVLGALLKQATIGNSVWQAVTLFAVVSAIIGPILGFDRAAEKYSKAALGHQLVHDRLKELLGDLKLSDLMDVHEARAKEIAKIRDSLVGLDSPPSERLAAKVWNETLKNYPSDSAWSAV